VYPMSHRANYLRPVIDVVHHLTDVMCIERYSAPVEAGYQRSSGKMPSRLEPSRELQSLRVFLRPSTSNPRDAMMNGQYDPRLVALSILVATIASYTALDLAGCVSASTSSPRKSWTWLIAGAVSMGTGIWAMHFIGMLAFHLPVPVAYDLPISMLSMVIAIIVSAIALVILRRPKLKTNDLIIGAILMGIGISAMHYTGMFAMQMSPPIRYDPALFATSVLIAMSASFVALWIALQLRTKRSTLAILAKLGSASVMGLAITGMHYTAMAAAHFAPGSICVATTAGGINSAVLAIAIGGSAMAILSLTLIVSALDAHFALNNARLARALEKITLELREAQGELLTTARRAGMAEIANNVLHNVGNVLNSVNVSASLIGDRVRDSKTLGLAKAVQLMNEHAADLGDFLTSDEKGKSLPRYLNKIVAALAAEKQSIVDELGSLTKSIEHIKDIVATQQSHSGATSLTEPVQIKDLMEDALRMNTASIARHQITVIKDFDEVPLLILDRHLVLQILVNLIGNANQAMDGVTGRSHQITLRVGIAEPVDRPRLTIRVEDDGEGIAPENLPRLFTHGFTTRKNGHGFGLHSCALAAKEMYGTMTAHSDGPGKGAAFTLELPAIPA
jgi:NO-binding membrane sensor protein with MHYT domain